MDLVETGVEQLDPQVVVGPFGTSLVWMRGFYRGVHAAIGGAQKVIDLPNGDDSVGWPAIAAGSRSLLVVWRHNTKERDRVLARRFDFAGNPRDPQPLVLEDIAANPSQADYTAPSAAFDGANFLVAWSRPVPGFGVPQFLLTTLLGEEGAPPAARETKIAESTGLSTTSARAPRVLWTGSEFFVAVHLLRSGHAGVSFSYLDFNAFRFDRANNLIGSRYLMPGHWSRSASPGATLTGSRTSFAWRGYSPNDLYVGQTSLDGTTIHAPRVVRQPQSQEHASFADILWNGSEHVLLWTEESTTYQTLPRLRAMRLDADLKAIDAEPFDVSSQPVSVHALHSMAKTPAGVLIAYSRPDAANNGKDRVYLRGLEALSPGSLPDLAIIGPVVVTPNPMLSAGKWTVTYRIANQGFAAAGATHTKISIGPVNISHQVTVADVPTPALASGASVTETKELSNFLPPGSYTVTVTLDHLGEIAQGSLANDTATAILNVVEPPAPLQCSFTLRSAVTVLPAGGGSATIQVIASDQACRWTVAPERGSEWLTIHASVTEGSGTIVVSADANPSRTDPRTATLIVGNASVVVRQSAVSEGRGRAVRR